MKRNLVSEIADLRSRSEFNSVHDFRDRLNSIERAFTEPLRDNEYFDEELLKYIPIATVACFEGFFRAVYRDLIDSGKPFSSNARKFNQSKNIKFDFDIIDAIQEKAVTIGEFISHVLPCNSFEDINSNVAVITGLDFIEQLKQFQKESIFEDINETSKKFKNDSDLIIGDIKRTFELRHIFCHEFATSVKLEKQDVLRCFNHSRIFLEHSNNFIFNLIFPNAPETQFEMNNHADEEFRNVENELHELILTIKKTNNEYIDLDVRLFDHSIEDWKTYRKTRAELEASPVTGGTMYPTLYAGSMTNTTREKIESLRNQYSISLRKYANS